MLKTKKLITKLSIGLFAGAGIIGATSMVTSCGASLAKIEVFKYEACANDEGKDFGFYNAHRNVNVSIPKDKEKHVPIMYKQHRNNKPVILQWIEKAPGYSKEQKLNLNEIAKTIKDNCLTTKHTFCTIAEDKDGKEQKIEHKDKTLISIKDGEEINEDFQIQVFDVIVHAASSSFEEYHVKKDPKTHEIIERKLFGKAIVIEKIDIIIEAVLKSELEKDPNVHAAEDDRKTISLIPEKNKFIIRYRAKQPK